MGGKSGWMMGIILASPCTYCMATLHPPMDKVPQAENLLKTKGRGKPFFKSKAENILKRKTVTINRKNPQKA
jgi:hypothetical protein